MERGDGERNAVCRWNGRLVSRSNKENSRRSFGSVSTAHSTRYLRVSSRKLLLLSSREPIDFPPRRENFVGPEFLKTIVDLVKKYSRDDRPLCGPKSKDYEKIFSSPFPIILVEPIRFISCDFMGFQDIPTIRVPFLFFFTFINERTQNGSCKNTICFLLLFLLL